VIKGKIADIVIRTYTSGSMIYRTLGLIQEAIDTLDKTEPDYYIHMGEATERYAIEASMAKIVGSEALGFVTDQGIQIFGGYGFIEEYPMAGPYRDTRIDRIWEGTNEINRQIVAGYMMRKALLEELPIREAICGIDDFLASDLASDMEGEIGDVLSAEAHAIETGKRLALNLFHEALNEFGQDLKHEQQLTEILADMFIDLYTADSTITRVRQLDKDDDRRRIPAKIARVHATEASIRLLNLALTGLNRIFRGHLPNEIIDHLRLFQRRMLPKTDIIQLKRDIAEHVYMFNTYPF
jgi:alkylation response protein AidB-like acyl-CoA dehydrogenase